MRVPFDSETSHARLLGQDVPPDTLHDRLSRRLRIELLAVVLVVHVVAHAHKLPPVVATRQEDDGDAEDFRCGDLIELGRVGFEDELVHTHRDWPDKQRVKLLVMVGAAV